MTVDLPLEGCRGRKLAKLGACLAPELVEREVGVSETTRLVGGREGGTGQITSHALSP